MNTAMSIKLVPDRLFEAPAQMDDEFGIYIHVPFCSHICPYCDFNTYAGQSARIPAYVEAVRREMALQGDQFAGRSAASIFIGGGTPSLLEPIQIRAILAACESAFALAPDAEVTIEAIPTISTRGIALGCSIRGSIALASAHRRSIAAGCEHWVGCMRPITSRNRSRQRGERVSKTSASTSFTAGRGKPSINGNPT